MFIKIYKYLYKIFLQCMYHISCIYVYTVYEYEYELTQKRKLIFVAFVGLLSFIVPPSFSGWASYVRIAHFPFRSFAHFTPVAFLGQIMYVVVCLLHAFVRVRVLTWLCSCVRAFCRPFDMSLISCCDMQLTASFHLRSHALTHTQTHTLKYLHVHVPYAFGSSLLYCTYTT